MGVGYDETTDPEGEPRARGQMQGKGTISKDDHHKGGVAITEGGVSVSEVRGELEGGAKKPPERRYGYRERVCRYENQAA